MKINQGKSGTRQRCQASGRMEIPPVREIAVITGASAGIGRATAREFAKRGSKIALLARGRAGLEAARREVEELGAEALVIPTDVADFEASGNRGWIAAGAALAVGAGLVATRLRGEKNGHPTHQ